MAALTYVVRWFIRFLILWFVDAVSLMVAAAILPGISIQAQDGLTYLIAATSAAFMLGIVNLLLRPLILLLALQLGLIATLIVGFFANALALLIVGWLMPALQVDGLLAAVLGGLVLAAVNTVVTGVLGANDEDSFYSGVVERLAKRDAFAGAAEPGRGLVMLEIDGLSFYHMQKALAEKMLPSLNKLQEEEGYVLTRVDCGLPSQTSACQAGIMFGDNDDIPAFRWYDKDRQKLLVSGGDAAEINARYAKGNGLMRGGSSINNMLAGDAEKAVLTMATLRSGTADEKQRRARDIYLLAVNPYFLMRTIVLMLGDALLEVFQYTKARMKNVQPRMDRLHKGYPLLRAACTVFMRDVAAYMAVLDIVRGSPSIYVTYPGYDEVAHHSGPSSSDAFGALKRYDQVIRHVLRYMREKAPRPYELIILSDHGQSFGATFKQRYGVSLKEFIEQQLPAGMTVAEHMGGDTGITSLAGLSGELDNVQQQGMGGKVGGAVVKQGQQAAQRAVKESEGAAEPEAAQVVAYGSGNLAQVYFDLYPRRIMLEELEAAFPGMIDCAGDARGNRRRGRLPGCGHAGGAGQGRAAQPAHRRSDRRRSAGAVRRRGAAGVAGGAGDGLSPRRRPDGGQHRLPRWHRGRPGGADRQPRRHGRGADGRVPVPPWRHGRARDAELDRRVRHPQRAARAAGRGDAAGGRGDGARLDAGQSAEGDLPSAQPVGRPGAAGARVGSRGLQRGGRRFVHDRPGAADHAVGPLDRDAVRAERMEPGELCGSGWRLAPGRGGAGACRASTGRPGGYTRTLRAVGFGAIAHFLSLLAVIPPIKPLAVFLSLIVTFFATWIGAVEAQKLRGWRGLVLPIVAIAVYVIGMIVVPTLFAGAALTLQSLAAGLGLAP